MKKLGAITALLLAGSVALAAVPKDTLVEQVASDIVVTLDPGMAYDTGSGQFLENMYETLLTYQGNSLTKLEPLLATSWKESNGGKTYTFVLRKNVKFSSGNPFTCADAEYTFRRNLVTNSAESGNWFLAESLLGTGANPADDKTITFDRVAKAVNCDAQGNLVFTLPKVDPAFLAKLAFVGQSVVDSKNAIKVGEWKGTAADFAAWAGKGNNDSALSKNPSGTGAYVLVKRDANTVLLKANPNYWGKKPAIQNVIVQVVPELATRIEAIKRGDADLIETGPRTSLAQLQGQPGINVLDGLPSTTATAFFMNQNIKNPELLGSGKLDGKGIPATFFSDVNVRRAFSYSFDYARYIKEVQLTKGAQRTMLLPETFPGYDNEVKKYSFNAQQATTYFKRAYGGKLWQSGFTLNMNYRAGAVASQQAAELLKQNIEALNPKFKVNVKQKVWADMLNDSKAGKEPMIILGWAPDYADADNFLYTFYSSNGYYYPRSNFKDANVDKWLDAARATTSTAARNKLYSQVANRAFEQAPYILLPAPVGFLVSRSELKGVSKATFNPMISFQTGTFWKELSK